MLASPATRIGSSAATPIRIASGPRFDDVIPTPVPTSVDAQLKSIRPPSNFVDFVFADPEEKCRRNFVFFDRFAAPALNSRDDLVSIFPVSIRFVSGA